MPQAPGGITFTADNVSGSSVTPSTDALEVEITETTSPAVGFIAKFGSNSLPFAPGETLKIKAVRAAFFPNGVAIPNLTILAASGTASFRQLEHGY